MTLISFWRCSHPKIIKATILPSANVLLKRNDLIVGRHYWKFRKSVQIPLTYINSTPFSPHRLVARAERHPSHECCNVTSTNRKWTKTDNFTNTSEFLRWTLTGVSIGAWLDRKQDRLKDRRLKFGDGEKAHRWDFIWFLLECARLKLFLLTVYERYYLHKSHRCFSALKCFCKYSFPVVISIFD